MKIPVITFGAILCAEFNGIPFAIGHGVTRMAYAVTSHV